MPKINDAKTTINRMEQLLCRQMQFIEQYRALLFRITALNPEVELAKRVGLAMPQEVDFSYAWFDAAGKEVYLTPGDPNADKKRQENRLVIQVTDFLDNFADLKREYDDLVKS